MATKLADIIDSQAAENEKPAPSSFVDVLYKYKTYIFIFLSAFVVLKMLPTETILESVPRQLLIGGAEPIYSLLISVLVYVAQEHLFTK